MNHDVIVLGASAGGVEVLLNMVGGLPSDLPASLFVVLHEPPGARSLLPDLLSRRGRLPASQPVHGEKIAYGHIYVAPPDNHLLVRKGEMQVTRGPRENGFRPAVDLLFRSSATSYGSRVIGVILSGFLDCGTSGMMSVKARGGLTVVQDPASAMAQDMPRGVLDHVTVDYVVQPPELPELLMRLVNTPADPSPEPPPPVRELENGGSGRPVELVCPECQGVLTQTGPDTFEHFRCHVGHSFSLKSLVREQSESLERALWAATRALDESAALSRRLSGREKGGLQQRFLDKAKTQSDQANMIRNILLYGTMLSPDDAKKV